MSTRFLANAVLCRAGDRTDEVLAEAQRLFVGFSMGNFFPVLESAIGRVTGLTRRLESCLADLRAVCDEIIKEHVVRGKKSGMEEKDFLDVLLRAQRSPDLEVPITDDNVKALVLDVLTQQDYLEEAASYIRKLRERIENLKQKRELGASIRGISNDISSGMMIETRLPMIEVRHQETNLEVVLISSIDKRFMFHEVIALLEEEGAEVISASFSVIGDKIFHTIHSQALSSRIGLEASRVLERLKELVR